jgi:hypothetical protein
MQGVPFRLLKLTHRNQAFQISVTQPDGGSRYGWVITVSQVDLHTNHYPTTPISLVSESWVIEVPESLAKTPLVLNQIPHLESYDGL